MCHPFCAFPHIALLTIAFRSNAGQSSDSVNSALVWPSVTRALIPTRLPIFMLASFSRTDFSLRLSCWASWWTFLDPAYCRRKSSSRFDQRRKLLHFRLKPSLRARSQAWNGHPVWEHIYRVADRLWSHPLLYPRSRSASSSAVQS